MTCKDTSALQILRIPLFAIISMALMSCASSLPPVGSTPTENPVTVLMDASLSDNYTYDKLGQLCDMVGHRLVGSPGMKNAIQWSVASMQEAGFDSVWTEPVTVPHWTRGLEWARVTYPVAFELDMIGMGLSDGTGKDHPNGIEAEILAVESFEELELRAAEAKGKIVLFNMPWEGYGKTVQYRVHGASTAARHGALAVLIRSVTGVSLGAPHTGMMHYADDAPRIPIAALTVENAGRLYRMCQRGAKPRVRLYMEAENHPDTVSYNVVGDILGQGKPEEIVLLSGHLDSWDVGTCAQDDGAGVALALGAARMILQQERRPLRTIRVVHFTCEEMGGQGGRAYLDAHNQELDKHVLALESDSGATTPVGFTVDADSSVIAAMNILAEPLLDFAPGGFYLKKGGSGVDVGPIVKAGVTGVGHRVDTCHYFDVHHSRADTFEKIDPDQLAQNVALIAGLIYLVADNPGSLTTVSPDGGH
jgi:carboxypeptidase Q